MTEEQGQYGEFQIDESQFMVAASDHQGHSDRVWFRAQPAMISVMDKIVQSKKFPLRSRGDFCRLAVLRLIKWLDNIDSTAGGVIGAIEAVNSLLRDQQFWTEYKEYVEKLNSQINLLKSQGDVVEAKRLLLESLRCLNKIPEGYWKDKYIGFIKTQHKDILGTVEIMSMMAEEEEG